MLLVNERGDVENASARRNQAVTPQAVQAIRDFLSARVVPSSITGSYHAELLEFPEPQFHNALEPHP